jgi:hypothetical protein
MTIRQNGGIFGRNPTFNNVTVDGILTVDQIVEKTGAAGITLDGVTLKDGNVVLANGNGIDFSATSGTGTSELFDDYEEGTWTPTVTSASGTFTTVSASGFYTRIGRVVSFSMSIVITNAGTAAGNMTATLPFAATSINAIASGREIVATGSGCQGTISSGFSNCIIQRYDTVSIIGSGRTVIVTGTYIS